MQPLLLLVAFLLTPRAKAGKIIGGQEAKPHSRPYMAFLRFKISGEPYVCGGFLVREDFVLTAAHCQGRPMNVTLGAHNIKEKERTQQVIPSRRAIPHPGYNSKKCANDLMLLQLKRKAKMTAAVSTIGLPSGSDTVNPGMLCSVAGWGLLRVNGSTANKLQEVELKVQRDEECKSRYEDYNTSTQMCVGNPRMRSNAMEGDSGGPLVCNGVAQGIVSYGKHDGTPPDVYTRISSCSLQRKLNQRHPGGHNIKQQERTQQVIRVKRAIRHPDYNPENFSNDIMLLQLERKAKQTSVVKPLSLPKAKARVKPGQVCSLAGWGQVAPGTPATTLQQAELTVQEDRVCESLDHSPYSRATQKCVGDPRKVKTSFKGDSGGPLVCKKVVHGTFSYGKANGIPPRIFTQVSHFLPWIKRTMKQL
ncbi:hypothetical protein R6Z07M_015696 [Ovis aries]